MRAIRYLTHGPADVLRVEEVPTPVPQDGQVLITVKAVGANVIDTVFRAGSGPWQRPLPGTVTGDVVGRVAALGPGVTHVAVGDRVSALAADGFAEQVLADAGWLVPVPSMLTDAAATALPIAAPLALRLLRSGQVTGGDTVLVHSAAGGIGHLAVQLARILGARTVVGVVSSAEKAEFVRTCGADEVVVGGRAAWHEQARAIAPGGVDVILDAVGGKTFHQGLGLLAPLGRMVTYGALGGAVPEVGGEHLFTQTYVTGISIFGWRATRPALARGDIDEVLDHYRTGRLTTAVHATLPLAEAARAHEILESRENLGRVVIVP